MGRLFRDAFEAVGFEAIGLTAVMLAIALSSCAAVRAGAALTVEAARAYCADVPETAKVLVRAAASGGQKVIDCKSLTKGDDHGR